MSQYTVLEWFAGLDCAASHGLDIFSNYSTLERP